MQQWLTPVPGQRGPVSGGPAKRWQSCIAVAALAMLVAACGRDGPTPPTPAIPAIGPNFGLVFPANGPGQCMGADALDAGYINGQKNASDLECTSEDLDIGFAQVSKFRVDTKAGVYTDLAPGASIPCTAGQQVFVITAAILENNAQDRYDIGVWINQSGGSALDGTSCLHFNLIAGQNGSSDVDGDQCGDMSQGVTATVPLDTLQVTCQDNPSLPGLQVAVGACVGFQHQEGGDDRVCPTGEPPGPAGPGFRPLTTPGTTAKCKCEPLILPLDIKATLRIVKQTNPDGDAQSFEFNPTYPAAPNFFLTDGQTNISPPLDAGTYSVDEIVPAGWALGTRTCVNTGGGAHAFTSTANGITVTLAAAEDVTCTFNNTKQATITVAKTCVGAGGTFDFTGTVPAGGVAIAPFTRTCGQSAQVVAPTTVFGNYTITEAAETGWQLTDITCTGGGANTSDAGAVATIGLDAGENVTCTFENRQQATITVVKTCIGGTGTFDFTGTVPAGGVAIAPFTRTCAQSGQVVAPTIVYGNYTITEAAETGFALTDITCVGGGGNTSDAGSVATVGLDAGENVTCTFTNTAAASITVAKTCVGAGGTFDFTATVPAGGTPIAGFTRTCGQSALIVTTTSAFGNYVITEAAEPGWQLTDLVCAGGGANTSDAGAVATVGLEAGETVTCTYTNTQEATITVAKTCVGSGGTFDFTGTVPAGGVAIAPFTRTCGQSTQVVAPTVVFGNYTITEAAETGWTLTDITCVGGGANTSDAGNVATIGLNAGENVTCTFTNTQGGTITLAKVCVGGTGGSFQFTRTALGVAGTPVFRDCGQSSILVPLTTAFGTYTITESAPVGWTLTDITCTGGGANTSDAGSTATVGLDAGENVVCTFTNTAVPEEGRMTGGGTQITVAGVRVSRGFTIHCDIILSNNIEINWGSNKWHIDKPIDEAACFDDPTVNPVPPPAPFDTFVGEATGSFNGIPGYKLFFTFVDAGEPGAGVDKAALRIVAPNGTVVLNVPLTFLSTGNIQAHYDQPHK